MIYSFDVFYKYEKDSILIEEVSINNLFDIYKEHRVSKNDIFFRKN